LSELLFFHHSQNEGPKLNLSPYLNRRSTGAPPVFVGFYERLHG
jgi:hypothetical protein